MVAIEAKRSSLVKLYGLGIKSKIAAALSDSDSYNALSSYVIAFRLLKTQQICRARGPLAKRSVDFLFPLPLVALYCTKRAWRNARVEG